MSLVRTFLQNRSREAIVYGLLALGAIALPVVAQTATGGTATAFIGQAGDAGVYVMLAIGLNVVIGFAGLLDIGYAAFFAIGAYTYGLLASPELGNSPLHHAVHLPFWLVLFIAMFTAGCFGVLLGFPTLRLRGDYLAIVTLGFGEIVPRVFRNLNDWTGGVNGLTAIDQPTLPVWVDGPWAGLPFGFHPNFSFAYDPVSYYVLTILLVFLCVIAVRRLQDSRIGRVWIAVREDERAASAMGVNTVRAKLLAFAIGASFSGFAGCVFAAKLGIVSPENFSLTVSVTVLAMIVLGGMGNVYGVIVGAICIYFIQFKLLTDLPDWAVSLGHLLGLQHLDQQGALGPLWPGLHDEMLRLNFLLYGLILVILMLRRPEGLFPSRIRQVELASRRKDTPTVGGDG